MKFLFLVTFFISSFAFGDTPQENEFYWLESFPKVDSRERNGLNVDGKPAQNTTLNVGGYGPWGFGVDHPVAPIGKDGSFGVDVGYFNGGHGDNLADDGYFAMGYYSLSSDKLTGGLKVNMEFGPCYSYNTTIRNGLQSDSKSVCAMSALVLEKRLSRKLGINVRVEIAEVDVPHSYEGTLFLAGLSKSFGNPHREATPDDIDDAMNERYGRWSLSLGSTQPNATRGHMAKPAFEIERTQVTSGENSGVIYSGLCAHEGNTGVTDRDGCAGLVGYEFKSPTGVVFGGEVGPYLTHDESAGSVKLDALSRLYIGKQIKRFVIHVVYKRAAEFSRGAHDRDGYMLQGGYNTH
jgi:hypothetical protein